MLININAKKITIFAIHKLKKKGKMKPLTFNDLQESGLVLTKHEAMKLQPHISKISQHGADGNNAVEFDKGSSHTATQAQSNTGAANQVKQSTGFETKQPQQASVEQKKLVAGNFNKKGNTLAADGYKIGDLYPRLETIQILPGEETIEFTVTEEYLAEHAELTELKVGDVIQVPKPVE